MANIAKHKQTIFKVGDVVKVHQIIKEANKERLQIFEGIVIKIKGSQENKSFTVRKIAAGGIGVERIWPLSSPWIKEIEVIRHGKVRRAKLYYLRQRVGKRATKVREQLKNKQEKTKKTEKKPKTDTKTKKKPLESRRATRQKAVAK